MTTCFITNGKFALGHENGDPWANLHSYHVSVVPSLVMIIMQHRVTRFVLAHLYKNDIPAFQILKLMVWPGAAHN